MADRAIKVSNILREIFHSALFIKRHQCIDNTDDEGTH